MPSSSQVVNLSISVGILDTIAVAMRFAARWRSEAAFAANDWLIIASLIPLYGMIATSTLLVKLGGLGKPMASLSPAQLSTFLKSTRVIVNEGTGQSPYFSIHPGAMFGAGVAREWYISGNFNGLCTERVDRKDIKAVVNFVDVEYTAKNPTRKRIRYFRVLVKADYTWMSRSQLIRCLSAQTLKNGKLEAVINEQQDRASQRIEIHKERGIHPDTGKELTNDDLDKMPWFSKGAQKKGKEDMDLDIPE
ncbi:MAG: hypothetical protein Q9167_005321 [Letrouitia subvulpina]